MSKIVAYIDGQNFLYRAADFLINSKLISDKQELIGLDFRYLIGSFYPNQNIEIKYFGVNTIKRQGKYGEEILSKTIVFADGLRRLKNILKKTDIKFYGTGSLQVRHRDECKKCGYIGYKMAEKGVDVGMAVEIVQDSFDKAIGKQIIISSDIDLLPAIKVAKKNHKAIDYLAFSGKQIFAISSYAESTKFIDSDLISESYVRIFNQK